MYKQALTEQVTSHLSSTIPMWLKRVRPDILDWLIKETDQYSVKNTMERVFIIMNGEPPKCTDDNYRKFDTYEKGYRLGCNLSHKCSDVMKNRVDNQRINLMEKYGVTNAAQLQSVQQKTKETNLRKYGVEHHSQNKTVKEKTVSTRKARTQDQIDSEHNKRKQTSMNKYGVAHHMMLPSQQEKVQSTTTDRYGVAFPLQNEDSLSKMKSAWKTNSNETMNEKRKNTLLDRYGVSAASRIGMSNEVLEILDNEDLFKAFISGKDRQSVINELGIHSHTLYMWANKHEASELFVHNLKSAFEVEVAEWLDSIGLNYEQGNRTLISPKEVDFYLPSHNLAIECCGLYWHSEESARRNRTYHNEKYQSCTAQNVRLLTIFQDEWNEKPELVKQVIMNALLIGKKLFARKCEVREIDVTAAREFVNSNHIQGYTGAKIRLGLYHDDVLVSVMTFGKPRFNSKYEWELVRYCSSARVTGGASKLFSYFNTTYSPISIVSYSDNRWFTGKMYGQLGFTTKKSTIGYVYTDYKKRYDRMQFQKHKLIKEGFDSSLSEWEIMKSRGFDRIWDCGQTTWEYNRVSSRDK